MTIITAFNQASGFNTAVSATNGSNDKPDVDNGVGTQIFIANGGSGQIDLETPITEGWFRVRCQSSSSNTSSYAVSDLFYLQQGTKKLCGFRYSSGPTLNLRRYTTEAQAFETIVLQIVGLKEVFFLDVNFKIHATDGFIKVYFNNGSLAYEFYGNTTVGGVTAIDNIRFSCQTVIGSLAYSNIILADEDTRGMMLRTMNPDAAGDLNEQTGVFSDVNKAVINDTTGLTSATADQITTVGLASPPVAGNSVINRVLVQSRAIRGATGPQKTNNLLRVDGVNYHKPDRTLSDTLPKVLTDEFQLNPATGLRWSYAELVALQAGVRSRT